MLPSNSSSARLPSAATAAAARAAARLAGGEIFIVIALEDRVDAVVLRASRLPARLARALEKIIGAALRGAAVAEREAAAAALAIGIERLLAVPGRDDIAILVIGDGHDLVHVFDQLLGKARLFEQADVGLACNHLAPHIVAHRHHPFEA